MAYGLTEVLSACHGGKRCLWCSQKSYRTEISCNSTLYRKGTVTEGPYQGYIKKLKVALFRFWVLNSQGCSCVISLALFIVIIYSTIEYKNSTGQWWMLGEQHKMLLNFCKTQPSMLIHRIFFPSDINQNFLSSELRPQNCEVQFCNLAAQSESCSNLICWLTFKRNECGVCNKMFPVFWNNGTGFLFSEAPFPRKTKQKIPSLG